MDKKIRITSCKECPYLGYYITAAQPRCDKNKKRLDRTKAYALPAWCPLEDDNTQPPSKQKAWSETPRTGPITYVQAASYILSFGKYKGLSIDTIAQADEGLQYLDYMRGQLEEASSNRQELPYIVAYLSDDTIRADVEEMVRKRNEGK